MPSPYEAPDLETRMGLLDKQRQRAEQQFRQEWQDKTRAYGQDLLVKVRRNQLGKSEAEAMSRAFGSKLRDQIRSDMLKFDDERDRIQAFYQPAAPESASTVDPIKQYRDVQLDLDRLEGQMQEQFLEAGPRKPGTYSVKKRLPSFMYRESRKPYDDPGGSGPRVYVREVSGFDEKGKPIVTPRFANQEELRQWAILKASIDQATKRRDEVLKNRHVSARVNGSGFDRQTNAGTLGDQVRQDMPKSTAPATAPTPTGTPDFSELSNEELKRIIAGG